MATMRGCVQRELRLIDGRSGLAGSLLLVYEAVLLDVYGTVVHDDEDMAEEVCTQVAELIAVEPSAVAAQWSRRLAASANLAYGARFRTLAELAVMSLAEAVAHVGATLVLGPICRRYLLSWHCAPLYDDSRPFLEAVNLPVCLVSDSDHDDLTAVLRLHDIAVAAVVTSEDARADKPRPEPFRLALDRLGRTPEEVIHIGNSAVFDVAAAAAGGIDTAFIDRDGTVLPPGITATYAAATLTALLPRLLPC